MPTVAMHPRGRSEKTDSLPAPLALETDVAAYNYRYMYFPGDGRRFPWMMFYQSEANTSNMGPNYFDMDLDKVIGRVGRMAGQGLGTGCLRHISRAQAQRLFSEKLFQGG